MSLGLRLGVAVLHYPALPLTTRILVRNSRCTRCEFLTYPGYNENYANQQLINRKLLTSVEKKSSQDNSKALKTVSCPSISKIIEDIISDKNSINTIPATNNAIVGGKEIPYGRWLTRNFAYSTQKMNVLAKLIRNKDLEDAKTQLKFTKRKYGLNLYRAIELIEDHIRKDLKLDPKHFFLKEVVVTKGKNMRVTYPFKPRVPVKIICRTSYICIRIERHEVECSDLEKVAIDLKKLMHIDPKKFIYRKPFYADLARRPRLMLKPSNGVLSAEPLNRYEGYMCDKKKYLELTPTDQKIYRLPIVFQSSAHTLRNVVGASKRYFKMRELSARLINMRKSIKLYKRKRRTIKPFT